MADLMATNKTLLDQMTIMNHELAHLRAVSVLPAPEAAPAANAITTPTIAGRMDLTSPVNIPRAIVNFPRLATKLTLRGPTPWAVATPTKIVAPENRGSVRKQ
jgi:hypothetical protein